MGIWAGGSVGSLYFLHTLDCLYLPDQRIEHAGVGYPDYEMPLEQAVVRVYGDIAQAHVFLFVDY